PPHKQRSPLYKNQTPIAYQKNQSTSDRLSIPTTSDRHFTKIKHRSPIKKINQPAIAYPFPQPAIAPLKIKVRRSPYY
ncbi:MAG: hypothetical protein ACK45T_01865, partial [Pseudanabaena sp.]